MIDGMATETVNAVSRLKRCAVISAWKTMESIQQKIIYTPLHLALAD